jgi:uncharacterized protein (TIGR03089 family)
MADALSRRDPGKPTLTWYDVGSGERVELSAATLNNWVAKTANLMSGDLGLGVGSQVSIDLPRHWLAAVCWLAADGVGAETTLGLDELADLAVIGPDRLGDPPRNDEVLAASLRPLGAAFDQPLPASVRDFTVEVRSQPDHFSSRGPGLGLEAVLAQAEAWQLGPTDRVAAAGRWHPGLDPLATFLAPLAAGASLVWVWNPSPAAVVSLSEAEGVTAWVGDPPIGAVLPSAVRVLSLPFVS